MAPWRYVQKGLQLIKAWDFQSISTGHRPCVSVSIIH